MVIGSIPALGYAWRIMIMPQGIVGQALAIAAFPTFSTLAARSAFDEMRRILADTLRLIAFLTLPATILLMILARPIVVVLFERGQFDPGSTEFVAWALLLYAFSLAGLAAIEILSRAFYALGDTRTPVLAGLFQLIGMCLLGLWLSGSVFPRLGWLAFGGLALGYSLSTLIELGVLLGLLRRKLGGLNGRHLWSGVWRMAAAALLTAGATWLGLRALGPLPALTELVLGSLLAAGAYLLVLGLLRVPEPGQVLGILRRRQAKGRVEG
jgi:putative peptidoglycan lipid II flippase